jgi:hypothetical protein
VIPTAIEWLAYALVLLGVMIVNLDRSAGKLLESR